SALVLVAEAGLPIPTGPRVLQKLTVRGVARALGGFDRVTVVRAGPLDVPAGIGARLVEGADEVIDEPARSRLDPEVTVLGPPEVSLWERPRWMAERLVRAVLARLPEGPRHRILVTVRRLRAATAHHPA